MTESGEKMKILVGYDGSNVCQAALNLAIEHAKAFNADVYVVASMNHGTPENQDTIDRLRDGLAEAKSRVEKAGIACMQHLLIRGMEPGEDLVGFAQEHAMEEIIIGVRRRSKVGKLLFGSTAQYVILKAPCPVVSVR